MGLLYKQLTHLAGGALALPIASVLQQEDIEATVTIQCLGVVKPMTNITSIPMKIQQSWHSRDQSHWLLNEIAGNLSSVLGGEAHTLVR